MSWDIFVQHLPSDAESVDDIPDDYSPPPIGTRETVIRQIREVFPGADFTDPSWGLIDEPGFSIEISLSREELDSFALHVRGNDAAAGAVAAILRATGLRGLDSSTGEIFTEKSGVESLRQWRGYRDSGVRDKDGT